MSRARSAVTVASVVATCALPTNAHARAPDIAAKPFRDATAINDFRTVGSNAGRHWVGTVRRGFTLPAHARQGPRQWYALRLTGSVTVRRLARPSLVYVSGLTNKRASVQIKLRVPARSTPRRPIRWDAYGLLDGVVRHSSPGDVVHFDARNYLQYRGVRPGTNKLAVQVEQYVGRAVKQATIEPSTTVLADFPGPASVRLRAERDQIRASSEAITVPVTVANRGGWPAREMVFSVDVDDAVLRLISITPRRVGKLAPGQKIRAVVRLRVRRAGTTRISIGEESAVTRSRRWLRLDIPSSAVAGDSSSITAKLAPLLVFLPALLVLIVPRRWTQRLRSGRTRAKPID